MQQFKRQTLLGLLKAILPSYKTAVIAHAPLLADLFQRQRSSLSLQALAHFFATYRLMPPPRQVVLLAGTNGKGSTSSGLAAMLQAAGHRVGLFTSPHLNRFNERIAVNGVAIADARWMNFYTHLQHCEAQQGLRLSFFEMSLALALAHFKAEKVDFWILEVGLGGRLDATNAIPHAQAVITPIDLDHQQILGDSIESIAAEKAAIISPNNLVAVAPLCPAAWQLVWHMAKAQGATLIQADRQTELLLMQSQHYQSMPSYLQSNLQLAATMARALGCTEKAMVQGVNAFDWPGRYQVLPPAVTGGIWALLDGAHNPHAIEMLLSCLMQDRRWQQHAIHLCFAALRNKNSEAMLALLRPHCCTVTLTSTAHPHSLQPQQWGWAQHGDRLFDDAHQGLQHAKVQCQQHRGPTLLLVTGSLSLVGAAREFFLGLPSDLGVVG